MYSRRWYDQSAACRTLLRQIQGMPQEELREFSARVIIHIAERLRKEVHNRDKKNLAVNSLGQKGLQGLYRYGEERRRWYDQNPVIHKAVGLFYTLKPEELDTIGHTLGDTLGLLEVYAVVCQQIEQVPALKDIANITTTSLQVGRQEAEDLLISLVGPDLYSSLSNKTTGNEPPHSL